MPNHNQFFNWPSGHKLAWYAVAIYVVIALLLGIYFRVNGGW